MFAGSLEAFCSNLAKDIKTEKSLRKFVKKLLDTRRVKIRQTCWTFYCSNYKKFSLKIRKYKVSVEEKTFLKRVPANVFLRTRKKQYYKSFGRFPPKFRNFFTHNSHGFINIKVFRKTNSQLSPEHEECISEIPIRNFFAGIRNQTHLQSEKTYKGIFCFKKT